MQTLKHTFLAASLIFMAGSATAYADVAYTLTDLGTGTESDVTPYDINAQGQVVGNKTPIDSPYSHAFLYSNGVSTDLVTLGGYSSFGEGINASGQIVGGANPPGSPNYVAFLYNNGVVTNLGTLGGPLSYGYSINSSGKIVGIASVDSSHAHAYLYSNGVMTDLGTFGGSFSSALAINDAGQIVGDADTNNGKKHAFLYSNGVKTDLGTLGGNDSYAKAINASGQVVGLADLTQFTPRDTHAFLYSNGTMTDLGKLGGSFSSALAINDSGQIVGHSETNSAGNPHAFLYSNGTMKDLNTLIDPNLGFLLTYATGINASGQIIGSTGTHTGYLLTPNVTIATAPQTAPHVVATPNGTYGRTDSRIYVTWSPVIGATSYSVFRGTVQGGFHTYIGSVSNATQFSDLNVQTGTPYYYIITAVNSLGSSPKSNEASATIVLPVPLSNLTATAYDDTKIDLAWTASPNAKTYYVYRSTASYTYHAYVGSTMTPDFRDTGLTPGTAYYYIVRPVNEFGEGPKSLEVTATTKVAISSISFTPSTVTGGANITGTLTLNAPAPPTNAVVQITSSNPAALYVPATAQLNAGLTSRTFTAYSRAVTTSTNVTVTATYGGVSKTTVVTVNP